MPVSLRVLFGSSGGRGVNLTVVEMEDRMLPRMMDETGGEMIKRWCEKKSVRVQTGVRVTKIQQGDGIDKDHLIVELDNGSQLPAHLSWLHWKLLQIQVS